MHQLRPPAKTTS